MGSEKVKEIRKALLQCRRWEAGKMSAALSSRIQRSFLASSMNALLSDAVL